MPFLPLSSLPSRAPWLQAGLAATALAVLAGCAAPTPTGQRAEPIAPARVGLASDARLPGVDAHWWRAFGDPQLDALVERALADHPNLQVAAARVARAAAVAAGTRAQDLPTAALRFDATHQRYTENGLIPKPLAGSWSDDATLRASVNWEIDFFGRNKLALESALGAERAAAADLEAARVLLASRVVGAYVGLARAVAQREVAERTLQQRSELLGLIRQRVDAGLDSNVELRQGEGALPDTRLILAQFDEQIGLARNQLAALTAQPAADLAGLAPALRAVQPLPMPEQIGAELLGRRPDIVAARWRAEAATQEVAVARTQFYPNVNLMAFVGLSAVGFGNLLDLGSRQAGFGPALSLPLFDTGRLRANLQGRAAELDAAVQSYNGAVLDAVREVADQATSIRSIAVQQREQAEAQSKSEAAYDLAMQRYRAGLGTYLVVLNAENSLLAQRRAAVDLRARALDAQAQLMRSLGGGWNGELAATPVAGLR